MAIHHQRAGLARFRRAQVFFSTAFFAAIGIVPIAGVGCGSGDASSAHVVANVDASIPSAYSADSVRHTFHSKLGSDIDCVDFAAEPGVRALVAQGASVDELRRGLAEMAARPSRGPSTGSSLVADAYLDGSLDERGAARACPEGTVPHVRLPAGASPSKIAPPSVPVTAGGLSSDTGNYAWVWADYNQSPTSGFAAQGGRTTTTIAAPTVPAGTADHSLSQVWVWTWGTAQNPAPTQTVEAGWWVDPGFYGDAQPRLFVAGTAQSYSDFCIAPYDCLYWVPNPGATLPLNTPLTPSVPGGVQHELTIDVSRHASLGGWGVWAAVDGGPEIYLGYFSNSWYSAANPSGLAVAAMDFKVGGEIYDQTGDLGYPPQNVTMGAAPIVAGEASYGQTAYHHDFGYYDGSFNLHPAGATAYYTSPYYVYDLTAQAGLATWQDWFYFGSVGCLTSCAQAHAACGTVSNGCGGTLSCGGCQDGTCTANQCGPLRCPRGEGDCGGYCCRCVGTTCS